MANDKSKEIVDAVKALTTKVDDFEKRIFKNEQLLLHTFSYLYARQDTVNNKYDVDLIIKDKNIKLLNDQILDINLNIRKLYKATNTKRPRKKRVWHYFISKYFKYKKLCKEREILHEEIRIMQEEKARKAEEERIKAEEKRLRKEEQQRLEKIKRDEEERLQKELRKQLARNKMSELLQNMNKGES